MDREQQIREAAPEMFELLRRLKYALTGESIVTGSFRIVARQIAEEATRLIERIDHPVATG